MSTQSLSHSGSQTDSRIAFFDRHAHNWDNETDNHSQAIHRLSHMQERIGLRPNMRVLEIGCGTGTITKWLTHCVGANNIVAIDFSSAMLAQAKAKAIPARFHQIDICQQVPPEGEFDLALCFQAFPHFRDQAAAVKNIAASLKNNGKLVVLHLVGSEQINAFHKQVGGAVGTDSLPSHQAWPSLLKNAGLVMQSLEDRTDLFLLEAMRP